MIPHKFVRRFRASAMHQKMATYKHYSAKSLMCRITGDHNWYQERLNWIDTTYPMVKQYVESALRNKVG